MSEQISDKHAMKNALTDMVEELIITLWENEEFQRYLGAIYDEEAVEGSLLADDFRAAQMIRDQAEKTDNLVVATQKLARITKAMGVVLRRYGYSRKDRRLMAALEAMQADES